MKSQENFESVKCNLCGLNNSNTIFKGKDMVHGKLGLFTIVKCNECGLIYVNPRPNQTIISDYYPNEYWDIDENNNGNIEKKLKKTIHKIINKMYYKMAIPPKSGGKILDIGCGDGKSLLKLKEDDWDTYGVEISEMASKYAREILGLNIFTGILEDAEFEGEFFDVVLLNNVLEHLSDPATTLKEINRILKNDGKVIISIPNVDSFEAKHFKKYWTAWDLPRHLYHFSPVTIKSILNKTGFEVLDIEYDNNPNIILSSFKYVFQDYGINPILGLILLFPFANLASLILGKTKRSYNMVVYSKKKFSN